MQGDVEFMLLRQAGYTEEQITWMGVGERNAAIEGYAREVGAIALPVQDVTIYFEGLPKRECVKTRTFVGSDLDFGCAVHQAEIQTNDFLATLALQNVRQTTTQLATIGNTMLFSITVTYVSNE